MKDRGILRNTETGDLLINPIRVTSGKIISGLTIGDVTNQNQAQIITMHPVELKEAPTVGVGISSLLLSHETLLYKHKIREQLEFEGQRVSYLNIILENGKLDIQVNGSYK